MTKLEIWLQAYCSAIRIQSRMNDAEYSHANSVELADLAVSHAEAYFPGDIKK